MIQVMLESGKSPSPFFRSLSRPLPCPSSHPFMPPSHPFLLPLNHSCSLSPTHAPSHPFIHPLTHSCSLSPIHAPSPLTHSSVKPPPPLPPPMRASASPLAPFPDVAFADALCVWHLAHSLCRSAPSFPLPSSVPAPSPSPSPCHQLSSFKRASASPLAPFLDFTFSDALCGTWATDYAALHARIRETARSHAPTLAQTAAAAANAAAAAAAAAGAAYPQPRLDPSIRFLTFEWLDEPGGLGDYITGLATAFACALLTRRAFIVRHPYLPLAFAPNLVDWSFSPDVPYEPARRLTVDEVLARVGEKGGEGGGGGRGGGGKGELVQEGEVVIVNLRNRFVEPEEFFAVLDKAMNAVGKKWTASLHALGIRPPYAFGCILRFLLKPQPEVISKLQAMYHQLLAPLASSSSSSSSSPSTPLQHLITGHSRTSHLSSHGHSHGASHGGSGHRVAVVGIHMRAPDKFVWQGQQGFGDPKAMSEADKEKLMAWAEDYIACAQVGG
ncbi:unnamed protein product [Closterium sp. Naga37s-1]|nr:unnamed protein product [Closterium sp. Naga37s-1]